MIENRFILWLIRCADWIRFRLSRIGKSPLDDKLKGEERIYNGFIVFNLNPLRYTVLVADDPHGFLDQLLNKNKVKWWKKGFFHNDNCRYIITMYSVPPRYMSSFVDTLEELRNKMLLLGFKDYEEFCETHLQTIGQQSGNERTV